MAVAKRNTVDNAMRRLDGRLTELMPKIAQRLGKRMASSDTPQRTTEQQWEDFRAMSGADMARLAALRGEPAVKQYVLRMLQVFAHRRAQEIIHGT